MTEVNCNQQPTLHKQALLEHEYPLIDVYVCISVSATCLHMLLIRYQYTKQG